MRVNLKRRYPTDDTRRKVYHHLLNQICDDYDLDFSQIRGYVETSDKHLDVLINYLVSKGYKISMFKFKGVDDTILSWGLEFDERCELTLALILRYADNER